jgi:ArsR family transcriptional regulator
LDVRPADEYAAGHIRGALNATLAQLEQILPALAPGAEIVAYCRGPYCVDAHKAVAPCATASTRGGWKAVCRNGARRDGRS